MRILISGASGFLGSALSESLRADGQAIARLVRPAGRVVPGDVGWDPAGGTIDTGAMEGVDAVIHLGGASIAGGRWTSAYKTELRGSRVRSTRLLVDALLRLRSKPRVFVCASAVGYYGNRGDEILSEGSGPGSDFLGMLARDWEAEALRASEHGIRTVLLRFGVVFAAEGGALQKMLAPIRWGVGGRLGDGRQWIAWVALEDAIGATRLAIGDERFSGPVNVVAPNPVRNAEFTRVVAKLLHRPAIFPAPAFALRLLLGEMADALLFTSQRAVPERLIAAGYWFQYESIEPALRGMLRLQD